MIADGRGEHSLCMFEPGCSIERVTDDLTDRLDIDGDVRGHGVFAGRGSVPRAERPDQHGDVLLGRCIRASRLRLALGLG